MTEDRRADMLWLHHSVLARRLADRQYLPHDLRAFVFHVFTVSGGKPYRVL